MILFSDHCVLLNSTEGLKVYFRKAASNSTLQHACLAAVASLGAEKVETDLFDQPIVDENWCVDPNPCVTASAYTISEPDLKAKYHVTGRLVA